MSEQPQEWTPETVADIVAARPSVPIGVSVADAHNAELAAEREAHAKTAKQLVDSLAVEGSTQKQLAAEQHKLKACEVLIRDLQKELTATR